MAVVKILFPGFYRGEASKDVYKRQVLNLRIGTMLCRCGKIGEIVELAVRNSMRSQGIGHGLFQEAYHIAREAGCVRFEVSTNRTRLGAHRFYEREGMERSHYRFIRYFSIEK